MEDDYTAPPRRETPSRSRAAPRAKWLKRQWRRSRQGNDYIEIRGYRVTVFAVDHAGRSGWSGTIVRTATGKETRVTKLHASSYRTKLAAFDTIEIFRRRMPTN